MGVPGREAVGVLPPGGMPPGVPAPGVLAPLAPPSQRVLVLGRTAFQSGSFCGKQKDGTVVSIAVHWRKCSGENIPACQLTAKAGRQLHVS